MGDVGGSLEARWDRMERHGDGVGSTKNSGVACERHACVADRCVWNLSALSRSPRHGIIDVCIARGEGRASVSITAIPSFHKHRNDAYEMQLDKKHLTHASIS